MARLLTIQQASDWASKYLKQNVTPSNISYLLQYGRVKKHRRNGDIKLSLRDLKDYYRSNYKTKEKNWKKELGKDLNWHLSFDDVPERERTKHVHRLHQYKGKFIPQLVEYFLDDHTDEFKHKVFFKQGDIILDPFVGSGTAMVQANELGLHSIGIDISEFNCLITKCKLQKYDIKKLHVAINFLIDKLGRYQTPKLLKFVEELFKQMQQFNYKFFPNSEYKYKINKGEIDENSYSKAKESEFMKIYQALLEKYSVYPYTAESDNFLDKWYMYNIKTEMIYIKSFIERGKDETITDLLKILLSRTIRSCRATTHSDLARLKEPQTVPYYCRKHKKICIPLYTLREKFQRYAYDTLNRIREFNRLRTDTGHITITGDSRTVDIFEEAKKRNNKLFNLLQRKKIKGIFTSPPYVGQIDYHEQHAYAYELFDFQRRDKEEIGPLFRGKGEEARKMYIEGITKVLVNIKKYLAEDYDIFLVANDRFNLYHIITEKAGMQIINRYKRPVLNRTARDRNPYSETVFHIKENEEN